MEQPTVEALTTVAGVSAVVLILVQAIWKASGVDGATKDRIGPLVAILAGIAVSVIGTFAVGVIDQTDVVQAVLTGIYGGAGAMALHDTIDSVNPNIV